MSPSPPQARVGIPDWAWGQTLPIQGTAWGHQPRELECLGQPAAIAALPAGGSDLEGDLGYPEVLDLPSEPCYSMALLLNSQSSITAGFLGAGLFS